MDKEAYLTHVDLYRITETDDFFVCQLVSKHSNGNEIPHNTLHISKALFAYAIKIFKNQCKEICESVPLYYLRLESEDNAVYDYLAKYYGTPKEIILMSYFYYKDNFKDDYKKIVGNSSNYYIFDKYRLE